jgi:ferredoxin-NADP reductase
MLRSLDRHEALDDVVHLHCARRADDFIFGAMMRELADRRPGYTLHEHHSSEHGRISPSDLGELCPDWSEREAFLSGPRDMIDAMQAHWEQEGDLARLRLERFQPIIGQGDVAVGTGGTVRFRVTDNDARCDAGISILVGGEDAGAPLPFGCRMGICHTCVGRLRQGRLRDLRTGEVHGEEGQMVRTCVNAPEGHVEIDL